MENRMDTKRKDNYRNIKYIFCEMRGFESCVSSTPRTTAPVTPSLSVPSTHIPPFPSVKGNAHLIWTWTPSLFLALYLWLQAGGFCLAFWASCNAPNGEKTVQMDSATTILPQQPRPSGASQPLFSALPTPIKFCFFPKRCPLLLPMNQGGNINNGRRNPLLPVLWFMLQLRPLSHKAFFFRWKVK